MQRNYHESNWQVGQPLSNRFWDNLAMTLTFNLDNQGLISTHGNNHMQHGCGNFFEAWQDYMDERATFWNIRNIQTGELFLNTVTRKHYGIRERIISWENAIRWVAIADTTRFEDEHSRVLKLGGFREFTIGVKKQANRIVPVRHVISAVHSSCRTTSLVLILTQPDEP